MTTITPYYINNKIIIISIIIAVILHGILISFSKFISVNEIEEIEPKIILELINDVVEETQPMRNKIQLPKIVKPQEIIKPPVIEPPKEIKLEQIKNNIVPNNDPTELNIPKDLKPITNNKIDIPKPIKNNNPDLYISEIAKITKPNKIEKKIKPIKTKIMTQLPEEKILIDNIKNLVPQIQNLTIKPIETKIITKLPEEKVLIDNIKNVVPQIQNLIIKPIKKKKVINEQRKEIGKNLTSTETSDLNNYKNKIRTIIQSFAINNYPKKEKRRKIEGKVHIIFKLRKDGSLEFVKSGPDTNASNALIKSAIESVKKSAPFEKITLLEQKNEFSITIIYKITR